MAIPDINVLGNPNVTEGNFQIAIEDLRKSVIGSGKAYDSANTYSQYDTCVSGGIVYYSKINSNTGNTPAVGANWGLLTVLLNTVLLSGNQTIAGLKTFSDGFISTSATQGIGYGTGAGGTVTQLTSKSTAVTLNKPTGQIITSNSALASGVPISFTVNNTLVTDKDVVILTGYSFGYNYRIETNSIANGYFAIRIANITAGSLSEALVINFSIIKGANA